TRLISHAFPQHSCSRCGRRSWIIRAPNSTRPRWRWLHWTRILNRPSSCRDGRSRTDLFFAKVLASLTSFFRRILTCPESDIRVWSRGFIGPRQEERYSPARTGSLTLVGPRSRRQEQSRRTARRSGRRTGRPLDTWI